MSPRSKGALLPRRPPRKSTPSRSNRRSGGRRGAAKRGSGRAGGARRGAPAARKSSSRTKVTQAPVEARRAFVSIHPGLEEALVDELRDLGLDARLTEGGATFKATSEALYAVHLYSRLAGQVRVRVATLKARNLEALAQGARLLPWKQWVWPGQSVTVKVSSTRSRLSARGDAVSRKLQHAIRDALRGPRESGPRAPREPIVVFVRLVDDRATLSVDASGERLHRRGWRQATAKAPLRENLAAAMLRLADWDPGEALVDPFCGAGTLPIEAATIATSRAPGLGRSFAFERWPNFDAEVYQELRGDAAGLAALDHAAPILAADRDPGAITASRDNARRAGVLDRLVIRHQAIADLSAPDCQPGLVITNPPYGHRVGQAWRRQDIFRHIGKVLRREWSGWRVALLLPDPALARPLGLKVSPVATFSNGGLPVTLVSGHIDSGDAS